MFVAYLRTFARMGLKSIPMEADTGPIGGDLSHEFIVLAETGESEVFCHADLVEMRAPGSRRRLRRRPAAADRAAGPASTPPPTRSTTRRASRPKCRRTSASRRRGIEVGHIFFFGTKYSEPMGCRVRGRTASMVPCRWARYGIGVSRLVGAIIEASHDENGIVWPEPVAPFEVGLINLQGRRRGHGRGLRRPLRQARAAPASRCSMTTRDERAGAKFATMDLIGLPWQLIVGPEGPEERRGRGEGAQVGRARRRCRPMRR